MLFVAGCSFNVVGSPGDPSGGAVTPPSPTQSVPNGSDGGAAPAPGSDMATQRIGTACTDDSQCDPGLFCAKSFGVGPGAVMIPGGYCTHECSQTACPANSFCGSFSFGKYCLSSCPPDPCRGGYQCCDNGGQNGCSPAALCGGKPKE